MTDRRQHEILRNFLESAWSLPDTPLASLSPEVASPTGDGTPEHPRDDEDLLLDWSLGDLSPERHRQLLDHLAACPACRREIAAMVSAGALVLPDVDAAGPDENTHVDASLRNAVRPVSERPSHVASPPDANPLAGRAAYGWRRPAIVTLVVALAASLLLLLAPQVFHFRSADGSSVIALAQRDVDQGRPGEAFARMETYLSGERAVAEAQRIQAGTILESSGYELARDGLVQGDFNRVSDIQHRVSRHTGGSSRLLNLRIQAERGETAEQSLSLRTSLVRDYGYETDGRRQIKDFSIPEITSTQQRIEGELLAGIEAFPDSLALRLNYGQFLLDQNEYQRAEGVFAEAVRRVPDSVLAQTGLGLALFQQNRPDTIERALEPFQKAVQLSPDDPVVNLNLAVCLARLGRAGDAQRYLERGTEGRSSGEP